VAIVAPLLRDKTISNLQEVKAREGIIVAVGSKDDQTLKEMSDYYFDLDFTGLDDLAPLYANVFCQLFAYYIAENKGTDIDKPRNLAKSVTVE